MASIALLALSAQMHLSTISSLRLHFVDVGYGDAIIIQFPSGQTALIDGGKAIHETAIRDKLEKLQIKKIDMLFITHFHDDHVGNLPSILEQFSPFNSEKKPSISGTIYLPFFPTDSKPEVTTLVSEIRRRAHVLVKRGTKIDIDVQNHIEILHPSDLTGHQNNDSMVLMISSGQHRFLLAADIGFPTQEALVKHYGETLRADLIKIPHHANDKSISSEFVSAVNAKVSVLTIGPNQYGAPNQNILMQFSKTGRVLRSDREGDISIVTEGEQLKILLEKQHPDSGHKIKIESLKQ